MILCNVQLKEDYHLFANENSKKRKITLRSEVDISQ